MVDTIYKYDLWRFNFHITIRMTNSLYSSKSIWWNFNILCMIMHWGIVSVCKSGHIVTWSKMHQIDKETVIFNMIETIASFLLFEWAITTNSKEPQLSNCNDVVASIVLVTQPYYCCCRNCIVSAICNIVVS